MKKIILVGIPHHNNIGDSAIAMAEVEMTNKLFPTMEKILIHEEEVIKSIERLKYIVNPEDIILLHGGGNLGDLYILIEQSRRNIIENFPNNKIIIFPQTIFFNSEKELNKSKEIYNNHKNLVIMAREEKSYEIMKKNFYNNKIYLTPDIVMSLKKDLFLNREYALFLLRGDKEKTLSDEKRNEIEIFIKENYENYIVSDMHMGEKDVYLSDQEIVQLLNDKFYELSKAELCITDRLHGMIFAAITETPCVAYESYTHKISEAYNKWLSNLDYIEVCDDDSKFEEKINKVMTCKNRFYDNSFAENIIGKVLKEHIII